MQPQADIFGFGCTCFISDCTVRFLSCADLIWVHVK